MATQDDFAGAREQDEKLKGRFTGALEQYGLALRDQPGRLLRAQQVGEQRLRAGTQSAIAGSMNTGPLGAGALGGMADVGATRAQQEAQFQTASEKALGDARMRAAQGEAEIAGLLRETGAVGAVRKIRDDLMALRTAGASRKEVRDYLETELEITSDPAVRKYLQDQLDSSGRGSSLADSEKPLLERMMEGDWIPYKTWGKESGILDEPKPKEDLE